MQKKLEAYLKSRGRTVEKALLRLVERRGRAPIPFLAPMPATLKESMAYSLMAGGKRLRPVLTMAAAECRGLPGSKVLKTACALEMIHTYSLIHDDLPAMDDDDLRRGKPTNHKVFGEAVAILAGDGLLTMAFELAAENAAERRLDGRASADLVRVIAAGSGVRGMVGGQAADLEAEGAAGKLRGNGSKEKARKALEYIHTHKTAALITTSLEAGAVLAKASERERKSLREYGRSIGLAFQIVDDILDRVGDKAKLGKRGSDLDNDKLTYPRLYGLDGSRKLAQRWTAKAHKSLAPFGNRAEPLHWLADFVLERDR
jgi:geranylgeranyl diphosphate synthase type II